MQGLWVPWVVHCTATTVTIVTATTSTITAATTSTTLPFLQHCTLGCVVCHHTAVIGAVVTNQHLQQPQFISGSLSPGQGQSLPQRSGENQLHWWHWQIAHQIWSGEGSRDCVCLIPVLLLRSVPAQCLLGSPRAGISSNTVPKCQQQRVPAGCRARAGVTLSTLAGENEPCHPPQAIVW